MSVWLVLLINFAIDLGIFLAASLTGFATTLGVLPLLVVAFVYMIARILAIFFGVIFYDIIHVETPEESYHKDDDEPTFAQKVLICIFLYGTAFVAVFIAAIVLRWLFGLSLFPADWQFFVLAAPLAYTFIPESWD